MSGHSKWKTIQHKKGAADAKRGKIFSRLSKELMLAARQGGGNQATNVTLRNLVIKAKDANMPSDNIDRAIKKGTGEIEGVSYDEIVYETYAASGVAIIVKVLTDNKNRAAAEIRHLFSKYHCDFAAPGSVSRSFSRKGQLLVEKNAVKEDDLMEIVLEAGAEDMQPDDEVFEILTDPGAFDDVAGALDNAGIKPQSAEVTLVPDAYVTVSDKSTAASLLRFVEDLEEHDDVQNVYTNLDVDDETLKELEG